MPEKKENVVEQAKRTFDTIKGQGAPQLSTYFHMV